MPGVGARPSHRDGRELLADALEQLGYQAETGPWRNVYLTGAKELRDGVRELPTPNTASPDSVRAMKLDTFLDYLGIRLNGPRATGKRITVDIALGDTGDRAVLALANGSLSHSLDRQDPAADATLTMARAALDDIILGTSTLPDAIAAGVGRPCCEGERSGRWMRRLLMFGSVASRTWRLLPSTGAATPISTTWCPCAAGITTRPTRAATTSRSAPIGVWRCVRPAGRRRPTSSAHLRPPPDPDAP